jgi:hypothetical protein
MAEAFSGPLPAPVIIVTFPFSFISPCLFCPIVFSKAHGKYKKKKARMIKIHERTMRESAIFFT